ncbi:hypothetical protein LG302_01000 [Halomonas organivorans]
MTDPDIIDDLIARITAECPGLVTVDEAPFAEPIDNFDAQTPAALVYLAEDGSAGDLETLRTVQKVSMTYGIWLLCERADFRTERHALREALFGHGFSPGHEPMAYRGGQTVDIRGHLIWWREFWTVDTWLRSQA